MILRGDFFTIRTFAETASGFECELELNPAHLIYKGHFPGHPVTPGVIQLQIVQELMEGVVNHPLQVDTISQSKFLNVLNPEIDPSITISVDYRKTDAGYAVKATGRNSTGVLLRLECTYNL